VRSAWRAGAAAIAALALLASAELGLGSDPFPDTRPIYDDRRVVAFYGAPQHPQLGILGIGSPRKAGKRLERMARRYERIGDREVLPAMELIGVIALANPGPGGLYRSRQSPDVIRRYLRAARRIGGILLLDIQPGRSTFMKEIEALEPFLRKPRVGIALDPEWNMGPGGVPGERVGHVGAREINRVSLEMSRVVAKLDLPQKLLVVHQFTEAMVRHDSRIKARRNVAVTMNVDGFGTPGAKESVYERLAPRGRLHPGFKLFFREDTNLMSPRQVLGLNPSPQLVIYE
jgi:hypothetical protein